jgi:ABC-type transport system involved in multi-copper enzyme maturation permease subunit
MNPIFASGARRRMRSMRTVIIVTLYGAIMLFVALLQSFSLLGKPFITIGNMRSGVESYIYLVALQFLLILLVAPGMTAGSIAGERERQTLDLVLVTNTGALRIALGKLMESFVFLALLILSSLPMLCVVLLFGGITVLMIVEIMAFMIITAFAALSVGLLASCLFKRTVTATVASYMIIFAIGVGTILPMAVDNEGLMRYVQNVDLLTVANSSQLINLIPKLVFINPGLGLISLMISQTGLLQRTFGQFPTGYAYYQVFDQLNFELIAFINMGVMLALSVVLTIVSAILIRPRSAPRREKAKRGIAA